MWLYSRSKNFAADNHPPRRRSGGAGTARQRRQPYQSRPQAKKGVQGNEFPWRCPRRTARRVGEGNGKI